MNNGLRNTQVKFLFKKAFARCSRSPKNAIGLMYGINAVPQNCLLNPNGVIIATALRGEDLMKKLGEILK
jgi:hypothetical protein